MESWQKYLPCLVRVVITVKVMMNQIKPGHCMIHNETHSLIPWIDSHFEIS